MFEIILENNDKPFLKISSRAPSDPKDSKSLLSAASVIRTLTLMGHAKDILPLESAFHHYNTLIYLRNGMQNYRKYVSKFSNDHSSQLSDDQMIEESLMNRRYLQTLAGLGSKIPDVSVCDESVLRINGLDELISLLQDYYRKEFDTAESLKSSGKTCLRYLFHCFPPGQLVLGTAPNLPDVNLCYRVAGSHYESQKTLFGASSSFHVALEFVAYLGGQFTMLQFEEVFSSHDNAKEISINELAVRPATEEDINNLSVRGDQYYRLCNGKSFMNYAGKAFYPLKNFTQSSHSASSLWSIKNRSSLSSISNSKGRIIIDPSKGFEYGYSVSTGVMSIDAAIRLAFSRLATKQRDSSKKTSSNDPSFTSSDDLLLFDKPVGNLLPICIPCIVGFSLTLKSWGQVLFQYCFDIEFNSKAYDMLVLPEERKEMIKALIKSHTNTSFSSIIEGKGEGIIFLLHGASGTGKTLTCEAIAELLRKPLYVVSIGELGTTPQELETNLQAILGICESWDSLILLDEADVFVEKRSRGEILRNSMVGVILRLIEYHRGIIFFTSNRVTSFDKAFLSRVTIALKYKQLDSDDRLRIWKNLLQISGVSEAICSKLDLVSLAKHNLNGRQIKNTIQLSLALSSFRRESVDQQTLESTVKMCLDFNDEAARETEEY